MSKDFTEKDRSVDVESTIIQTGETEIKDGVTCPHGGSEYDPGSTICIDRLQYICNSNGQWSKTGKSC